MSEWIEWKGGECPVNENTLVQVRLNDGCDLPFPPKGFRAGAFRWSKRNSLGDIIAYRIVKEKEE